MGQDLKIDLKSKFDPKLVAQYLNFFLYQPSEASGGYLYAEFWVLKFYSPLFCAYKFFRKKFISMGAMVVDSKSHWTGISELFWWF